ncbi:MAG: hypothetical protein Q7V63_01615 [Gammaproteobacteria bacterium]|nr:hypothetical protein [Gammaproteobacteria bacterium]
MGFREFRGWAIKEDEPIAKKIMNAFERAAQIPLPSDLIFTDYYLMKDWMRRTVNKYFKASLMN